MERIPIPEELFEEERALGRAVITSDRKHCRFCFREIRQEVIVVDGFVVTRFPIHHLPNGQQCIGRWTMTNARPIHPWLYYLKNLIEDFWEMLSSKFA